MPQMLIQPIMEKFPEYRDYAEKMGFSFEIVDFAALKVLNSEQEYRLREEYYQRELADWCSPYTMHGAFIDINIHSPDKEIRRAARKRVHQNLTTARKIGARAVVFHTNFSPVIRNPRYRKLWLEESTAFWQEMIDEFGVQILLENMWEPTPDTLQALIHNVNSDLLKVCLDTGHLHVFSRVPLSAWCDSLGEHIVYYHFNDNHGETDEELPPGDGNIDWSKINSYFAGLKTAPAVVLEVGSLAAVEKSVAYLRSTGLLPYGNKH